MSLIKDLWEIWVLIKQYNQAQKEIAEERNSLEDAFNRIWNPPNL